MADSIKSGTRGADTSNAEQIEGKLTLTTQDGRTNPLVSKPSDHQKDRQEKHQEEGDAQPSATDERHVNFDVQAGQEQEALRKVSLRASSSAFLASLSSGSNQSSPFASPFPSSDSLQISEEGDPGDEKRSLGDTRADTLEDNLSITHNQSTRLRAFVGAQSRPSTLAPVLNHTSETSILSMPNRPPSWRNFSMSHQTQWETAETSHLEALEHSNNHAHGSNSSVHLRSDHHPDDLGLLPSPNLSGLIEDAQLPRSTDRTPTEVLDPFSSMAAMKRDEAEEESHSKTPLLQLTDPPPPKETDQLVKDSSSLGNKMINNYEVVRRLGSGAHGTVKLATDVRNGQKVAIKVVRRYPKKGRLGKREKPEEKVKKEVAVLKKARHPHIVSLLEVIDDIRFEKVYLVLEYVERGEINWRKETTRDIASFELNRIGREKDGKVDEEAEFDTLARFNDGLMTQHTEKLRLSTHRATLEDIEDNNADLSRSAHDLHLNPSLPSSRQASRPASRTSSRPPSQPPSRPPSRPFFEHGTIAHNAVLSSTARRPSYSASNFVFENDLHGSMYGPYDEDTPTHVSDFEHLDSFEETEDVFSWSMEQEEFRYVPCLTISEARDVFRDTILGLEYLHFHGIIHRDIKPANLLWTRDYRVKISDFGVSYLGRQMEGEDNGGSDEPSISHEEMSIELAKTVGTPAFYAPELCDPELFDSDRKAARPHITGQIDVWALGVTLYAMIFGRLPFSDANEFAMYEKIAKAEVFIPSKRLRGVEDQNKVPMNSNKREDHVLQYENIEDDLRDLIRRLLVKDPSKRITLKEVKHHPWVLHGVDDKATWIEITDPSYKGSEKIEVSQKDVQDAMTTRGWYEGIKSGIKRLTSVMSRGRADSRKRAESSAKPSSASVGASPRAAPSDKERHRQSLNGDELVYAIRASRENADHPLSYSTLASPIDEKGPPDFVPPISYIQNPSSSPPTPIFARPSVNDRSISTAESILTLRPTTYVESEAILLASDDSRQIGRDSAGSSSSSISKIIDGTKEATRRIAKRVRSRDPGKSGRDESDASRTSSADNLSSTADDHHVQPIVGVSPLVASGQLQHPMMLNRPISRESTPANSPELGRESSSESVPSSAAERGRTTLTRNRANTVERIAHSILAQQASSSSGITHSQRIPSSASSDDPNLSGSGEPFSPIPSNTSGASLITPPLASPSGMDKELVESSSRHSMLMTGETITPALMKRIQAEHQRAVRRSSTGHGDEHDDAEDEGSDDEGIVMGGGESMR